MYVIVMDRITTRNLYLLAPLLYVKMGGNAPLDAATEEQIYHYEINHAEAQSIEPREGHYLSELIEWGIIKQAAAQGEYMELPAGKYLFAQVHESLNREDSIHLACEVQKDGLWEQEHMENHLYLRYFHEHGNAVTQILRPLKSRKEAE
ncbi:MAG: hypothetical protein LBQ88_20665 [Treponema sp.]|jgi:hypothetical protein|nr:hypothetical protein [Treponema sp.]